MKLSSSGGMRNYGSHGEPNLITPSCDPFRSVFPETIRTLHVARSVRENPSVTLRRRFPRSQLLPHVGAKIPNTREHTDPPISSVDPRSEFVKKKPYLTEDLRRWSNTF